jgi:hypothetical protein
MNQEYSYSNLTAMDGINGATVLKFYSQGGRGIFYTQASGKEDQFQLSVSKSTGHPDSPLPAVTFSSDKFALDINHHTAGLFVLRQLGPGGLESH